MTLSAAPTLTTDRLILRAHTAQDFESLTALWSDPEVIKFISPTPFSKSESWSRLLRYAGHWQLMGYGFWALTTRDGEFLGDVGFANHQRDMTPPLGDTPEAGWVLAPHAHGRGIATEAMETAHNWLGARFSKTVAIFDPAHSRSHRVAEKLGYQKSHRADFSGKPTLVMARSSDQFD